MKIHRRKFLGSGLLASLWPFSAFKSKADIPPPTNPQLVDKDWTGEIVNAGVLKFVIIRKDTAIEKRNGCTCWLVKSLVTPGNQSFPEHKRKQTNAPGRAFRYWIPDNLDEKPQLHHFDPNPTILDDEGHFVGPILATLPSTWHISDASKESLGIKPDGYEKQPKKRIKKKGKKK